MEAVVSALQFFNPCSIKNQIEDLKNTIRHNKKIKETINELSKLSDKELRDIGINRGDIWTLANGVSRDA